MYVQGPGWIIIDCLRLLWSPEIILCGRARHVLGSYYKKNAEILFSDISFSVIDIEAETWLWLFFKTNCLIYAPEHLWVGSKCYYGHA